MIEAGATLNRPDARSLGERDELAAAVMQFANAMTLFGTREIREFPKVARAAFASAGALTSRATLLRAANSTQTMRELASGVSNFAGAINGTLIRWLLNPKGTDLPPVPSDWGEATTS